MTSLDNIKSTRTTLAILQWGTATVPTLPGGAPELRPYPKDEYVPLEKASDYALWSAWNHIAPELRGQVARYVVTHRRGILRGNRGWAKEFARQLRAAGWAGSFRTFTIQPVTGPYAVQEGGPSLCRVSQQTEEDAFLLDMPDEEVFVWDHDRCEKWCVKPTTGLLAGQAMAVTRLAWDQPPLPWSLAFKEQLDVEGYAGTPPGEVWGTTEEEAVKAAIEHRAHPEARRWLKAHLEAGGTLTSLHTGATYKEG